MNESHFMKMFTPFNQDQESRKKVKNKLPPIKTCLNCNSEVHITENKDVYGSNFGDYPWIYLCSNDACDSYVGIHPNTDIPLGTIANSHTRTARKRAKGQFTHWMQKHKLGRAEAYKTLANLLGIPRGICHFGWFDAQMCKRVEIKLTGVKDERRSIASTVFHSNSEYRVMR
jgi:hypothetical protein